MSPLLSGQQPFGQPYRWTLLAYPREYRYEHGAELVELAQQLSGTPWSIRESASFIVGGLRTRGLIASQQGPRSVWAAGIRVALLLRFLLSLSMYAAFNLGTSGDLGLVEGPSPWLRMVGLGAACLALTITTRWPTALLVSSVCAWAAWTSSPGVSSWGFTIMGIGLSWWLAFRTDGRRAMSPVTMTAVLGAVVATAVVLDSPHSALTATALFFSPALVGLFLMTVDPRPLVVAATTWAFQASVMTPILLSHPGDWKFIAVPTALAVVGIGLSRFSVRRVAGSSG